MVVPVENLPDGAITGFTRPDWFIFGQLADRLDRPELKYKDAQAVLKEIGQRVPGFPAKPDRKPRRLALKAKRAVEKRKTRAVGAGPYLLVAEPAGFGHRGIDLSSKVEGLEELALEEGFRLSPDDLRKLRVKPGGKITISTGKLSLTGPARAV